MVEDHNITGAQKCRQIADLRILQASIAMHDQQTRSVLRFDRPQRDMRFGQVEFVSRQIGQLRPLPDDGRHRGQVTNLSPASIRIRKCLLPLSRIRALDKCLRALRFG